MSKLYTGVRVINASPEAINEIYKTGSIEASQVDGRLKHWENQILVLKTGSQSAIGRYTEGKIVLLRDVTNGVSGVRPRNKEQKMAFDLLLDPKIRVVALTGTAGTGKTLLALASALHLMEKGDYSRFILSRPMSQVGDRPLGILPGEVEDKFHPYLGNYMDNIEHLLHGRYNGIDDLISQYRMEFKPLQTMRGASWSNALILADEIQVLTPHEMVTLGTRMGEGSKLILMGDLNQRDENIAVERTGIFKWINSDISRESPLSASIELIKCERSEAAALFAEVFGV